MATSDPSTKFASEMEEGRIVTLSHSEKEGAVSPTMSSTTTFVGSTYYPSEGESHGQNNEAFGVN